jgi:hypothetical protein
MTLPAYKAIEAVVALFPVSIDAVLVILRTVVAILAQTPNAALRANGIEQMTTALLPCEHLEYLLECRALFALPEAARLVRLIGEQPFAISPANCRHVFEVLEAIGPPGLQKLAENLLCFGPEEQARFISDIAGDVTSLLSLWNRFCDPKSRLFDQGFFERNNELVLKHIFWRLEARGESEVLEILGFLQKLVAYPKTVGSHPTCTRWHLFGVIPFLLTLLGDGNCSVSSAATTILAVLEADLEQIIVD